YFLQVEGLSARTGNYTLTTEFLPALPPFQPLPVERPKAIVTADLNGDDIKDIATTNRLGVGILLGLGDGTFQKEVEKPIGTQPSSLVTAYFNDDGYWDIATATPDFTDSDQYGFPLLGHVSILLGNASGTFDESVPYELGTPTGSSMPLVTGDFNGDCLTDLA